MTKTEVRTTPRILFSFFCADFSLLESNRNPQFGASDLAEDRCSLTAFSLRKSWHTGALAPSKFTCRLPRGTGKNPPYPVAGQFALRFDLKQWDRYSQPTRSTPNKEGQVSVHSHSWRFALNGRCPRDMSDYDREHAPTKLKTNLRVRIKRWVCFVPVPHTPRPILPLHSLSATLDQRLVRLCWLSPVLLNYSEIYVAIGCRGSY